MTHWDWSYFALFMIDTIAKAVFLAWMYNGTGGSLLLVAMAHSAWNTTGIFIPVASTVSAENLGALAVQVTIEVLIAVAIVVFAGPENLSRTKPKQVQRPLSERREMPYGDYSAAIPAE